MALALCPRPSPCSIHSRYGSQVLAARAWLSVGGEICRPKSGVTSLAGFAVANCSAPESGVTSLAGYAGARRPQARGGRTAIPAAFR
jgi:hypothetical protein